MEKHFVTPQIPLSVSVAALTIVSIEVISYGIMLAVPAVWSVLIFGLFYVGYHALFRRDTLPTIFALLFFTAHHSLFFHFNRDLPIALLFMLIFGVNAGIMWLLLHYATHLKKEYHVAYSVISGFMIAQLITLFASMIRDWSFRFELAAYIPTVFSYIFWRFACLSSDAMLGWKQFIRLATLVLILLIIMVIGSPNTPV